MNIFSFNSSDPAVKSLLFWKVGGEEEKWALKAVESLVKKLRKKNGGSGTVEDLEFALGNPVRASKCVTIARSQDGRLQVSHKKNLPHVIYCKLWRWPNVQSHHELKPIPSCQYPYDSRSEQICINPYHYIRVEQQNAPIIFRPIINPSPNEFYRSSPGAGYMSPSSSGSESEYSSMFHAQNYLGMQASEDLLQQHSPYSQYTTSTTPRQNASPSALSDDNDDQDRKSSLGSIHYQRPSEMDDLNVWCTISYYELNSRIGEPFKVSSNVATVDGFTDPSNGSDRICLGLLSNVNRNHITENTRRHIGEGVRFECDVDKVTVTNISQSTFFIQSRNANYQQRNQPATVCRVPANTSMVIFDFKLFKNLLERAENDDYQNVYELQKMCFIRMSFVKGWGQHYHRQEVTSTPCWIEMTLHSPLAQVDGIITKMLPPDDYLTNSK